MNSYLIVSPNNKFIDDKIKSFKKSLHISEYNYMHLSYPGSIGINDIKELRKIITVKPFSAEKRLIVIREIEKATTEAQNAMLKILEEPPAGNYFLLTTSKPEKLLPTIISRCQEIADREINITAFDTDMEIKKIF